MEMLSPEIFQNAINRVNLEGFAAVDLGSVLPQSLGEPLYKAMDQITLHPDRNRYYNELAFYWPEDWTEVPDGIGSFHQPKSLKHIYPANEARDVLTTHFDAEIVNDIFKFVQRVKNLTVSLHQGLKNNELRLSRVMLRQMNEKHMTRHSGAGDHEDIGYSDRPYQQLLSVIITTYGIPTVAERHHAKVGELLVFNAYDRRRLLELPDAKAFIHRGPTTGPKMFFFFEFLGPRG